MKKSTKNKYSSKAIYYTPIKAPVKQGDAIGELLISYGDKIVQKIPLVAKEDVAKIGPVNRFMENLKYFVFGNKE